MTFYGCLNKTKINLLWLNYDLTGETYEECRMNIQNGIPKTEMSMEVRMEDIKTV